MDIETLNLSWNNKGEYIFMIGNKWYSFNKKHLKYYLKHFMELIEEIKEDKMNEGRGKEKHT